jgi:hypothetical protein
MNDRRRALIALLDQYPLERDLYLHDGRRDVSPRDEFAEKIEALYAPSSEESHIDYVMGGSRPLLERYHDALEVVRKQAIIIQELEATPSLFQRVMEASKTFVERFPGGHLTFHGAARKMQEEYFEFQRAVGDYAASKTDDTLPSEHFNSYQELRKEAAREMIDLLVTVGGLGATIGLTWEDIQAAARETLDKLDSRTTDTHQWSEDSLTVERIGKKAQS